MLVAISDLHFIDGTAGAHNLPYEAFKCVFLIDVVGLAREKKANCLEILLLGDIFDLIRSTRWLKEDEKDRPWGENGLKDIPNPRAGSQTERICQDILGVVDEKDLALESAPDNLDKNTILHQNWKTFKLFRDIKEELQNMKHQNNDLELKIEDVKITYIPGNHDRLCNLYPSLRKLIRQYLGLSHGQPENPPFKNKHFDPIHGVIATHGHQYDTLNFADTRDHSDPGFLKVSMGDLLTTEFAVKIPWLLDQKINQNGNKQDIIEKAQNIDNVRPLSAVMKYLYYGLRKGDIKKEIDNIFKITAHDILNNKFVQEWRSPGAWYDEFFRAASSPWLNWLSQGLVEMLGANILLPKIMPITDNTSPPRKDIYLKAASRWKGKIKDPTYQYVLFGHTHIPLCYHLDSSAEANIFYINTGTWRNRIQKTVFLAQNTDFVAVKQMAFSVFYNPDEDTDCKIKGTFSFDIWTGMKNKAYNSVP